MFCPRCGQERVSTDTKFCSKCGFLLSGTLELLMTGGVIPSLPALRPRKNDSPRSRGVKQGLFTFLLTFLVVPIVAMITLAMKAEPFMIAISAILLFIGGLLRMAYAWMFESPETSQQDLPYSTITNLFPYSDAAGVLPSASEQPPVSLFAPPVGQRRTTNDLRPVSVTEGTTQLLEKELDQ